MFFYHSILTIEETINKKTKCRYFFNHIFLVVIHTSHSVTLCPTSGPASQFESHWLNLTNEKLLQFWLTVGKCHTVSTQLAKSSKYKSRATKVASVLHLCLHLELPNLMLWLWYPCTYHLFEPKMCSNKSLWYSSRELLITIFVVNAEHDGIAWETAVLNLYLKSKKWL